jgi:hypothetical protein
MATEQPNEITLTRSEAIDMLVAMEDALDVLRTIDLTAAAFALVEQRDALFDRLWPNFPHLG